MAAPQYNKQADQNALTKKSQTAFRSILHSALLCVCVSKCLCADVCSMSCMKDILAAKTYSTLQPFVAFLVFVLEFLEIEQDTAIYTVVLLPPPQNSGIFRLFSRQKKGAPPASRVDPLQPPLLTRCPKDKAPSAR